MITVDMFGNTVKVGDHIMYMVVDGYQICRHYAVVDEIHANFTIGQGPHRLLVWKVYDHWNKWNTGKQMKNPKRVTLSNPAMVKVGAKIAMPTKTIITGQGGNP